MSEENDKTVQLNTTELGEAETPEAVEVEEAAEVSDTFAPDPEPLDDESAITQHLETLRAEDEQAPAATPAEEIAQAVTDSEFLEGAPEAAFEELAPKRHILRTVILSILGVILLAAAGLAGYAYYVEKQAENTVLNGVTFNNKTQLGGMDKATLRQTIQDETKQLLSTNIVITQSNPASDTLEANSVTKPLSTFVDVKTENMIDKALEVRESSDLITRLKVDLLNETLKRNITYEYSIDEKAVAQVVNEISAASDKKAINATMKQEGGKIVITPSENGFKTNTEKITADIHTLIKESFANPYDTDDTVSVELSGKVTKPKKPTSYYETRPALIVTLSRRQIALYNGEKLIKTYQCAIGTPDHPTPVGTWSIVLKRYNPTWVNPGSEWAKSMPKTIPPGPTNPLGLRALNLNASGIRIHGTTSLSSIGTAASHGCMRMRNEDIVDLYPRVNVGTPVYILP